MKDITFNDPLYEEIKTKVNNGKPRIPYREYLYRRTVHYIEHVANDQEVEDIKVAIQNRVPNSS